MSERGQQAPLKQETALLLLVSFCSLLLLQAQIKLPGSFLHRPGVAVSTEEERIWLELWNGQWDEVELHIGRLAVLHALVVPPTARPRL